ncbi:hypothetical protein UB31_18895 [Bradyrhizobium sp. LTSP849]|uniref:hypothetical protein n=1 Tax=Bradyrhizobium sp. LTSP849 TaxID=1615890 RepID=UPI0005D1D4B8|nr:hypothetical protein [Bradyrhizobium sp. LTSP849]KJC47323.1 hypothetical protein UB31_18895 [Bradyrhizobium sp. LTSP849]
MNRLQKFEERGAYGERPGRIAYALDASRLPEPTKGLDWRPVSGFNAEDALRDDPGLKPIFEKAMKQGYALVTREK